MTIQNPHSGYRAVPAAFQRTPLSRGSKVVLVANVALLGGFGNLVGCGGSEFSSQTAKGGTDGPSIPKKPAIGGDDATVDTGGKGGDGGGGSQDAGTGDKGNVGEPVVPPTAGPAGGTTPVVTPSPPVVVGTAKPVPSKTPAPPVGGDICADRKDKLRVLILDLKSGWFAGDGGRTFERFTTKACKAQVEIVYAHVTRTVVEGNVFASADAEDLISCLSNPPDFFDGSVGNYKRPDLHTSCLMGDLSSFQQVWLLSGSEADGDDVPVVSPFFASLQARMTSFAAGSGKGLFFGAGLGNTQHANALTTGLPFAFAGSPIFAPGGPGEIGAVPNPSDFQKKFARGDLKPAAKAGDLGNQSFDAAHALMKGLASLADYDKASQVGSCSGDAISIPGLARGAGLLARDACGQASVAAMTAMAGAGGSRVVLDANMARYYVTKPEEWFNRIVLWLAGEDH